MSGPYKSEPGYLADDPAAKAEAIAVKEYHAAEDEITRLDEAYPPESRTYYFLRARAEDRRRHAVLAIHRLSDPFAVLSDVPARSDAPIFLGRSLNMRLRPLK